MKNSNELMILICEAKLAINRIESALLRKDIELRKKYPERFKDK